MGVKLSSWKSCCVEDLTDAHCTKKTATYLLSPHLESLANTRAGQMNDAESGESRRGRLRKYRLHCNPHSYLLSGRNWPDLRM